MDTFYVIGAINSTDYSLLEILYGLGLSGIIPDFLSTTGASSQSPCVPFLELLSLTSLVGLLTPPWFQYYQCVLGYTYCSSNGMWA